MSGNIVLSEERTYNDYLDKYIIRIKENSGIYQFIIEKCCGYSFLIHIHKDLTLNDLYKMIGLEMENNGFNKLYKAINYNNDNLVPRTTQSIKSYICASVLVASPLNRLKPIYSLPDPIVYRLYLDDGFHSYNDCCYCNNGNTNATDNVPV